MSLKLHKLVSSVDYVTTLKCFDIEIITKNFILKAKHNDLSHARLGYNIPKKGTRFAHRRNRLKRLLKEYFRLNASNLPNMDYVLVLRRDLSDVLFLQRLEVCFSRATRLQKPVPKRVKF